MLKRLQSSIVAFCAVHAKGGEQFKHLTFDLGVICVQGWKKDMPNTYDINPDKHWRPFLLCSGGQKRKLSIRDEPCWPKRTKSASNKARNEFKMLKSRGWYYWVLVKCSLAQCFKITSLIDCANKRLVESNQAVFNVCIWLECMRTNLWVVSVGRLCYQHQITYIQCSRFSCIT